MNQIAARALKSFKARHPSRTLRRPASRDRDSSEQPRKRARARHDSAASASLASPLVGSVVRGPGQVAVTVGAPADAPGEARRIALSDEQGLGLVHDARVQLRPHGDGFDVVAPPWATAQTVVGTVRQRYGQSVVTSLLPDAPFASLALSEARRVRPGEVIIASRIEHAPHLAWPLCTLPDGPTLAAQTFAIAADCGTRFDFSGEAEREADVSARRAPSLALDLRDKPFVTIDPYGTRMFDQAIHLERNEAGFVLRYAIADVVDLVRPGSAIDHEARVRGAATYLGCRLPDAIDGLPMLPPALSYDAGSLRANADRGAFVATVHLDARGEVSRSDFDRALIHSRDELTFGQVQWFFDNDKGGRLITKPYGASLSCLQDVGDLLMARARRRGLLRHAEAPRPAGASGWQGIAPVKDWSDHLSIVVNELVAERLVSAGLRAPYLVSPEPGASRCVTLRARLAALGLPWSAGQPLSAYLQDLCEADPRAPAVRDLINAMLPTAQLAPAPAPHVRHALNQYTHFTAPLRRYEDMVVHRILAALIAGEVPPYQGPGELDDVIAAVNAAGVRRRAIAQRRDAARREADQAAARDACARPLG